MITALRDKVSYPFIPSFIVEDISKDVVVRAIPKYNGVSDPIV